MRFLAEHAGGSHPASYLPNALHGKGSSTVWARGRATCAADLQPETVHTNAFQCGQATVWDDSVAIA